MNEISFDDLWKSDRQQDWQVAFAGYWRLVKSTHMELEKDLDQLDPSRIIEMDGEEWFSWLRDDYFRWKYTAPNRLATTTMHLKKQHDELGADHFIKIRDDIFGCAESNVKDGLEAAMQIRGLGTAGASGLLSLVFPKIYGTVDQFIVKRLLEVSGLPQMEELVKMNPESLTVRQGVLLIEIMSDKADDLNRQFDTNEWNPRKVDMAMWGFGR